MLKPAVGCCICIGRKTLRLGFVVPAGSRPRAGTSGRSSSISTSPGTMHTNVLPGITATGLRKVAATRLLDRAYLAGGTAAALQLGHRISRDLDFFTGETFDETAIVSLLEEQGLRDVELDRKTILGRIDGVDFSYFHYKYPLL